MNWYKISQSKKRQSKDMEEFDYGREINNLWRNMLQKEMDRINVHFDLENNDGYDIKTKDLKFKERGDRYRIKARISWAGGDWESPICYFKCQYEERSYFERDNSWGQWQPKLKTIIIPEKSNVNLTKGKDGLIAKQGEEGAHTRDIDEKALWDEMVKIAEKRIKEYWKAYLDEYDGDGDSSFKNTGCIREMTGIYR